MPIIGTWGTKTDAATRARRSSDTNRGHRGSPVLSAGRPPRHAVSDETREAASHAPHDVESGTRGLMPPLFTRFSHARPRLRSLVALRICFHRTPACRVVRAFPWSLALMSVCTQPDRLLLLPGLAGVVAVVFVLQRHLRRHQQIQGSAGRRQRQ